MAINRKPIVAAATAALVAVSLAACGGGSDNDGTSSAEGEKGGTLYYLSRTQPEHLDPQRIYIGRDISNFNRLVYRGLLTFDTDGKMVPDIATDTGTALDGAKAWEFTVRDGVKWEDGQAVTCEDFKYGISRLFATDVITGGPNYMLGYIDIPQKDGLPIYNGPYKKANQDLFDKAVTCDGSTLTVRFNKPWPDFPLSVASLRHADPYRADKDQGEKSNFEIFSNGPYKLDGKWDQAAGGTFIRNDQYGTDDSGTRDALPDSIVYTVGLETEVIAERMIQDSGNDQFAVTDRSLPPAFYSQITGTVEERATQFASPFISYLLPNFKRMTNPKVRQALMWATNTEAYINTEGGSKAALPAKTIVNPALVGYVENPVFAELPATGDIEKAKALLAESGEKLPYKIKYTYNSTPTQDKAAAALKEGWDAAGFQTTLDPLTDTYYTVIQSPEADSDVMWGGWGADWPSIATVIPPLFDSRINFTENSNGQDYGNYESDEVNALIDEALSAPDVEAQAAIFQEIDKVMAEDVAYIPLDHTQFYRLHGSKITGYVEGDGVAGYPDLGKIGVEN